jgi:hypothetical protein
MCLGRPATIEAQTFEAGVKGVLAISSAPLAGEVLDQVVGQPSIESSSKLGVTGGAYLRFPLSNLLSFQPEALFVMKGLKLTQAAGGGTMSVRLHYLDVPLLLHFRVRPTQRMPGYVLGGANFGMKLGGSATLKAPSGASDINIGSALKTLDLGVTFGGGIERGRYFIEGRYTLGATDIGSPTLPHPDAMRNRVFSVLFGKKLK